jgi:hypothetical protein
MARIACQEKNALNLALPSIPLDEADWEYGLGRTGRVHMTLRKSSN